MDIVRFPHKGKIYIALLVLAFVIFMLLPRSAKFKYDYKKGSVWEYDDLVAQYDFPLLKSDEQLHLETSAYLSEAHPYFRESQQVRKQVIESFANVKFGEYDSMRNTVLEKVSMLYENGIASEIATESTISYIERDGKVSKYPVSELYSVTDARAEIRKLFEDAGFEAADSVCNSLGLYELVAADLVLDKELSQQIRGNVMSSVSPTQGVIKSGTPIISKGDIVTDYTERVLDSYKAEYQQNVDYAGPGYMLWISNALMAVIIVILLFLCILYTNSGIFEETNKFLFILTVFLISALAAILCEDVGMDIVYMCPFALCALYLLAFFRKRVVLPVYIVSLLPLLIVSHNGIELFVMNLFAGVVCIFTFGHFNRGWKQFINAAIVFFAMLFVWAVFTLLDDVFGVYQLRIVLYIFLGSLLLVGGYPLIYLFEKVFALVSSSRLLELCDTNSNKLLQELSLKAPGTFQHSLQVMNMCDAAAVATGANVNLVRAGAMYHDVGKIMNPQCFIENTNGSNEYHNGLAPVESARSIVRHSTDGLVLADKYKLPSIIKDFIITHHGTTCAGYFYSRFLQDGGDPASEESQDFFYKGRKPSTKEQVILMLCDSVEAAARSLQEKTPESLNALVDKIFQGKMNDGQIANAEISMKDLNTVRDVLKAQLQQIHHPRVAYPAAPETKKNNKKRR